MNAALVDRVSELAADVGRLRRRFASNEDAWTGAYIADRLADQIESLFYIVEPSAGELVKWMAPGDEEAVVEALRIVDARWKILRGQLGRDAA